jgi:hypothetical protein
MPDRASSHPSEACATLSHQFVLPLPTAQRDPNNPKGSDEDGANDVRFSEKVKNYTAANPDSVKSFTGPLTFLASYEYILDESLLTGLGAVTEMNRGVSFWNRYGRTLFNATRGQLAYNSSFQNASARPKPVLRTTGQSRIWNSQINWALGFFGTSYEVEPNPTLANASSPFELVVIPEGGTENNTLASYDSCLNDAVPEIGYIGTDDVFNYLPHYLGPAAVRLSKYVPSALNLTVRDVYAMQSICAYETQYIGSSDFCNLFTADEWAGFESSLDILYYYDYAYGNPTGRAQGIGYVQELLARLKHQYIPVSNSSVNSTITNNTRDFPLGQPFYADFSHDDILISVLTALSVDYFRPKPSLTQFPPDPERPFNMAHLTPFGANLITEVVGCSSSSPKPVHQMRTQYYPTQYGYDAKNASNKFIRMRLNNGILPLSSIRGGACKGRSDGLCAMDKFFESQEKADERANYQYVCFGNWTIDNEKNPGKDYDGTFRQK